MGSLMGLLALAHSLGMLLGPLFGGILIDLYSFYILFIVGATIIGIGSAIFLTRH